MSKPKITKDPFAERESQKYENPIPSREFILDYLAERGRPATYLNLVEELHLSTENELEALRRRLIAMVRDGQLMKNRKGAYGPIKNMEMIAGRVIGHKDGFGFIVPDEGGEDLFVGPREMRNVFHGDRVLARVTNIDSRGRREANIVEVLERRTEQLVGRFFIESGAAYVEPSNQRVNQDILIPPDAINGAEHGQIVVVAITMQPTMRSRPLGEIVEVLGNHMAPGMEINVAIRNHELPFRWPEAAEAQANSFGAHVKETDIEGREDYRQLPFVTIDGEDAKDFDDAVYCEARPQGGYKLYVAIADVAHYVRPGSPLDEEAYKRGNSVYFPARVIPMLPEALSNNLCSLKPEVDRLVMACEMTISETGSILRYRFTEGVIHSHARLTYNQVHAMMEKQDRRMRDRFKAVVPHLENLYALFRILQQARNKRGAIDFDMPETKIVYGKDRKIEKIVPYERFNSHKVIEECMLAANICAAKYLAKNEQPTLYRVHEGPSTEKLQDLQQFLQAMGLKMGARREPKPADYGKLLAATKERPDARMIQTVLLRSMSQAIYSPENKGHFGLAYDAYAHFTSPIRRYPDLLVHRGLKNILQKVKQKPDINTFVRAGEHCSMTERRADDATREAIDWLKCEFMQDKVGQAFDGIITGVTSFGIFVELKQVFVEGLVHISNLPDDYYQFNSAKHSLTGDYSKRVFQMGGEVKIIVARVDLDKREMDFMLDEPFKSFKPGKNKSSPQKKSDNKKKQPQKNSKKPAVKPAKAKKAKRKK